MKSIRHIALAVAYAALAAGGIGNASALDYPTRPIRWVLGYPAGGAADIVARIMGQWLTERLGQSVIIENKSGAGTNIAAQSVLGAPPDGYTLLWVSPATPSTRHSMRRCRSISCAIPPRWQGSCGSPW